MVAFLSAPVVPELLVPLVHLIQNSVFEQPVFKFSIQGVPFFKGPACVMP